MKTLRVWDDEHQCLITLQLKPGDEECLPGRIYWVEVSRETVKDVKNSCE